MACAEFLLMQTYMQMTIRYGLIWMGNIGEQIANELAINHLGLSPTGFTPVKHGIDGVFTDNKGKTVVVDSKVTAGNPFLLLHETVKSGNNPQLSDEWISLNATLMQRSESAQSVGMNPAIGAQIQKAVVEGNLRSILVHTNFETQEIRAYERISNENIRSASSWKMIDSWKME